MGSALGQQVVVVLDNGVQAIGIEEPLLQLEPEGGYIDAPIGR